MVGRDLGSIVAEGQRKLAERLQLPSGYTVTWGGAFEHRERAMARLQIVVPVTIGMIVLLLVLAFNSLRSAAFIMVNLPFALFGVVVENGIVLVSTINGLRGATARRLSGRGVSCGCVQS